MKDLFEKTTVCKSVAFTVHLVDTPSTPSMNRRIHISKRPFVGGNLPIRVEV